MAKPVSPKSKRLSMAESLKSFVGPLSPTFAIGTKRNSRYVHNLSSENLTEQEEFHKVIETFGEKQEAQRDFFVGRVKALEAERDALLEKLKRYEEAARISSNMLKEVDQLKKHYTEKGILEQKTLAPRTSKLGSRLGRGPSEKGLKKEDIDTLVYSLKVSRKQAVVALKKNDGNALMASMALGLSEAGITDSELFAVKK